MIKEPTMSDLIDLIGRIPNEATSIWEEINIAANMPIIEMSPELKKDKIKHFYNYFSIRLMAWEVMNNGKTQRSKSE